MARAGKATASILSLILALALLAALLLPVGAANAAVILKSVEEMARGSASVVVARVVTVTSRELPLDGTTGNHVIVSDAQLVVENRLAGSGSATLTVTVPGGTIDGLSMAVSEAPRFAVGDRCVLFLDGAGRVVADRQGKLDVEGDWVPGVSQSLATVEARISRAIDPRTTDPWYATVQGLLSSAPEQQVSIAAAPVITGISPALQSAGTGSQVVISGTGFGAAMGGVTFYESSGFVLSAAVVSWSDTSIVCQIPSSASSGPVVVTPSGGTASGGYNYAVGFSYSGLRWETSSMSYYVNPNCLEAGADELPAVQAAAASWTGLTPFSFVYAGLTSSVVNPAAGDDRNEIYWATAGFSGSTLAWNRYWYDGFGHIVESDIVFNDAYAWGDGSTTSNVYDIQSIAVHELGHSLSLDDQYGGGDAGKVMYGYGDTNHVHRALSLEDAKGITYIFGASSLSGTTTFNGGQLYARTRTIAVSSSWTGATEMRFDNGAGFGTWMPYASSSSITLPATDGPYAVRAEYRSVAMVVSLTVPSATVVLETTIPATTAFINGGSVSPGSTTAWLKTASLSLSSSEAGTSYYDHDSAGRTTYSVPVSIAPDGTHTIKYWSVDAALNSETTKTITVRVDSTPPTTSASVSPTYVGTATITIVRSDAGSGVAWSDYQIDSSPPASGTVATTSIRGPHTIKHRAMDNVGNLGGWSAPQSFTVLPDLPAAPTGAAAAAGPSAPSVAVTWNDNATNETGYVLERSENGGGFSQVAAPPADTTSWTDLLSGFSDARKWGSTWTYRVKAMNAEGSSGYSTSAGIRLDTTAPTIWASTDPEYANTATITIEAADAQSRVAWTEYRIDGGAAQRGGVAVTSVTGTHTIEYRAMDVAGNVSGWSGPQEFVVEHTIAPVTTAHVNYVKLADGAASAWAKVARIELLLMPDEVATTRYAIDSGEVTTYAGPFQLDVEGAYTLAYWSFDAEPTPNVEDTKTITVRVDRTPPVTSAQVAPAYFMTASISITAADGALSGVAWTEYELDSVVASGAAVTTSALGRHALRHRAMDNAGNLGSWSPPQYFSVVAPTSISAPGVSPSRPRRGKYATFTAWLSPTAAAFTGAATLELYRYETKTVHKKVRGRVRHVRVKYWRLRSSIAMTQDASGRLTARSKPRYSGKWRARVVFGGSAAYLTSTSGYRSYTVR
jgi:hypothetical protein